MNHHFRSFRPRRSASTRAQARQRMRQVETFLDELHRGFLSEVLDKMEDEL